MFRSFLQLNSISASKKALSSSFSTFTLGLNHRTDQQSMRYTDQRAITSSLLYPSSESSSNYRLFSRWQLFAALAAGTLVLSQLDRLGTSVYAAEDGQHKSEDPRRLIHGVEAPRQKYYDLPSAHLELTKRLETIRGKNASMWPPLWLSLDRPFVKFVSRTAPQKDMIRLAVSAFGPNHGPLEISQEHVGSYSCIQLYSPVTRLVVVLATSSEGSIISVEKIRYPEQLFDDWACWSPSELDLITSLYTQGNQHVQQSVSELEKLGLSIYQPDGDFSWDDIAGYDGVKHEVQNTIILALRHPEIYDKITSQTRKSAKKSNLPKAILFEGSPGVGKTQMAKAIASSVSIPLIYVPVESVMSKWYGESEQILSKIFDACSQLGEAIIFIDEIDSLATARSGDMHEATRRVLSVLLRQIEGFEQKNQTIVIGATNRKQDLDEALLSRFDISISFPLPSEEERAQILSVYATHLSTADLKQLAHATPRASGRDLRDICAHAERAWAAEIIRRGQLNNPPPPPLPEYLNSIPALLSKLEYSKNRLI